MRKLQSLFVSAALSLIVSVAGAQEQTITFQQGVNGYTGLSDVFVRSGVPDDNFEGRAEFEWDGQDGGVNYGLIWFQDIIGTGANQIPPNSEIVSAELQTFISNSGSSSQFSNFFNLLVEWDPETVTFNSIFGEEPVAGTHFAAEPTIQVFHESAGNPFFVDLTTHVQAFVDGMANNGFVAVPDVAQSNGFGHVASEASELGATSLTVETPNGTFEFVQGQNGYEGLKDAWIGNEEEDLFTNFGTDVIIDIDDSGDFTDVRFGLVRFEDIFGDGENQIPMGTEITSAQSRFVIVDPGSDPILREVLPHTEEFGGLTIDTRWVEEEVTFENFVADGFFTQLGVEVAEEQVTQFSGESGIQEVDVTSSLQKWSTGELENLGWILEPGGSGGVNIVTKEAAEKTPKLVVTFIGGETAVTSWSIY